MVNNPYYVEDKINLIISNLLYLTILGVPLFYIIGPGPSNLMLLVTCILFITLVLKYSLYQYFNNFFFYSFLAWCIYLIVISFLSSDYLISLEHSAPFIRYSFFILAVFYLTQKFKNFCKNLLIVLLICYILLTIDSYITLILQKNLLGFINDDSRLSSFFGDEKIMGNFVLIITINIIALLFYIKSISTKENFFIIILILNSLFLIILSGERRSLILFIIFCTLHLIFYSYSIKKKLIFIFLSIIILITIFSNNNQIRERFIDLTISDTGLNHFFNHKESEFLKLDELVIVSPIHEIYFTVAYNMFRENILFGVGPKMFRVECQNKEYKLSVYEAIHIYDSTPQNLDKELLDKKYNNISCSTHAHNTYLNLAAETGIFGVAPLVLFFLYILFCLIRYFYLFKIKNKELEKNDLSQLYLVIYFFIMFFPLSTSGNIFNSHLSNITFLPLGILLGLSYNNYEIIKKN